MIVTSTVAPRRRHRRARRLVGLLAAGGAATALLTGWSGAAGAASSSYCDGLPGNLVANCGFETGDFSSWTLTGDFNGYTNVSGTPHSGAHTSNFGNINDQDAVLSQTFQATPGAVYNLSFWVKSTDFGHLGVTVSGPGGLARSWDDSEQRQGLEIYPYTHVVHHFRADSTGTVTLALHGMNRDGHTLVDDVSVTLKPVR